MKTIRSDAPERLEEIVTLLDMLAETRAEEVRKQHMERIRRLAEMLRDSVEDVPTGVWIIGAKP